MGLVGVALTFIIGLVLGGVADYFGGTCDALVMRTVDLFISIPKIPLWMALAAAVPRDWPVTRTYFAITVVLSIIGWTNLARVVIGKLLVLREEDFVMAAEDLGSHRRQHHRQASFFPLSSAT